MQSRNQLIKFSPVTWVIILGAMVKFALHLINARDYGLFFDELYTMALSRHLAFGYVDLPPLVPALVALSRAILGESLLAMHIVPALAGAATLVFVCLITKEFGGRAFAVALSALAFIVVPLWLTFNSAFCYDCIDQFVLAAFLYTLVQFLRSGDKRLWPLLGLIAGIACLTKMTILFLGPGFLVALLFSRYRKDLLTPWPWSGAVLCLVIISPYLLWEMANHWPTLDYWYTYGTIRVYKASLPQYFMNIMSYMNPLLLPLWAAGLYRIFRRLNGVNYGFLGILFLFTLTLLFSLHATVRLLGGLFIPLIAAGSVFMEELLTGASRRVGMRALPVTYLLVAGIFILPTALPILPIDSVSNLPPSMKYWYQSVREFNADRAYVPVTLLGRVGWEEFVRDVADVYTQLPAEDRRVAGIYTDWYFTASAIGHYGPRYGLPHAVSGALTYYLWGPGDAWDVMMIVTGNSNYLEPFFEECTLAGIIGEDMLGRFHIYVCRGPKLSPNVFWPNLKNYH